MSGFKARRISFIVNENLNQIVHTSLTSEPYLSKNQKHLSRSPKIGFVVGISSLILCSYLTFRFYEKKLVRTMNEKIARVKN